MRNMFCFQFFLLIQMAMIFSSFPLDDSTESFYSALNDPEQETLYIPVSNFNSNYSDEEEEEDNSDEYSIVKKSSPRRIFIGKREFDTILDNQYLEKRKPTKEHKVRRIFIGKRSDFDEQGEDFEKIFSTSINTNNDSDQDSNEFIMEKRRVSSEKPIRIYRRYKQPKRIFIGKRFSNLFDTFEDRHDLIEKRSGTKKHKSVYRVFVGKRGPKRIFIG
jgi:hypothetical protein